jgi:hypothetical protein
MVVLGEVVFAIAAFTPSATGLMVSSAPPPKPMLCCVLLQFWHVGSCSCPGAVPRYSTAADAALVSPGSSVTRVNGFSSLAGLRCCVTGYAM